MKRIFFAVMLLFPLLISAQEKTTIGINAGATFANINDGGEPWKYGFDILLGLSFEIPLEDRFSLLTNINYERKTAKETVSHGFNFSNNTEVRFTMNYITVPLNLKYYFDAKKKIFAHAGPYFGIFIDDTFTADGKIMTEIRGASEFKKIDLGLTFGIGTRINVDEKHYITLGLRSNLGLPNVSDMPNYDITTNSFNFIFTWENIL